MAAGAELQIGDRIAGRYRVEAKLAQGGAGTVYAVHDEPTNQRLALKRLLPDAAGTRLAVLFEREYRTLASLRHPRIIDVHDYGVERGAPYYTMELLDGSDMRELSPMPYPEACRYLRDVTSSLVLLHARRLLHRDLSARNVRRTDDGRCKLIDFGALTPFGVAREIVGTPPCVPPEAIQGMPLDQRADLYALGALAYFMLTGHHAYRAKRLEELPQAWKVRPSRPSNAQPKLDRKGQALPPIPRELDQLVISLLDPDPLARPPHAAAVIDRLNAIAGLDADSDLPAESYLASTALVGRDQELERIERALHRMAQERGTAMLIEGAPGAGTTRMLEEIAVRAQLAGASVLLVEADAVRGPYSLAREIGRKLVEVAPELALGAALPHAAVLIDVIPELAPHFRSHTPAERPMNPGMWRAQVQSTLVAWLLAVARRQHLVLAIDGFEDADDASAALLATLAVEAIEHPLLIACASHPIDQEDASPAARLYRESAQLLALGNLSEDATARLVGTLFGDVPDVDRLAGWVYGLAAGNPASSLELLRDLVRRGAVRHREGMWVLPRDLGADELPQSVDELIVNRLERLEPTTLRLARALSVHPGPLSLEVCVALFDDVPHASTLTALEELTRVGVLRVSGGSYHFAQPIVRDHVLEGLDDATRQYLHRRLGQVLLERAGDDLQLRLDTGWHVLHGGDEDRGAELLAEAGLDAMFATDDLGATTPALEAALAIYRKQGRRPIELLRLLSPLTMAGYAADRRLAEEYGPEAIELAEKLTGLALARRLRPLLGKVLSLGIGLATGALRFLFGRGYGGSKGLQAVFENLGVSATLLAGVSTICLDAAGVRRYAQVLEPLTVFGRRHVFAFNHQMCLGLLALAQGQVARTLDIFEGLLARLEHGERIVQLPKRARPILHGGVLYALGAMQGFMDGADALVTADKLEAIGLKLYDMAADQVRMNYYACRGEIEQAEHYRRRVETHAIRNGSAWQVEVWAPSSMILAYVITDDAMGMKRTAADLERLAEQVPSLVFYRELAHGAFLFQAGRHEEAIAFHEQLLADVEPMSFIGWAPTVGSGAFSYNELGRYEEAKAMCLQVMEHLSDRDYDVTAQNLRVQIELARAEAGLGEVDAAMGRLEGLLARHRDGQGPVTLGSLHAAIARLSLAHEDLPRFEHHLGEMERWWRPTRNPALIAQCQQLRRQALRVGVESERPPPLALSLGALGTDMLTEWQARLGRCVGTGDRAGQALALMIEQSGAAAGYLYAIDEDRLQLIAPRHGEPPPEELTQELSAELARRATADDEATAAVDTAELQTRIRQPGGPRPTGYQTYWLGEDAQNGPKAVVRLMAGTDPMNAVSPLLLETVSISFRDAGDFEKLSSSIPPPLLASRPAKRGSGWPSSPPSSAPPGSRSSNPSGPSSSQPAAASRSSRP